MLPAFTAFLVSIPPATAGRTARRATAADAWGGPGTAVLMLVLLVLVLEKLRPAAAQGGGWRALDDGQGGGCCTDPIVTYGCRNFGPCHPTTVVHTTNGPVAGYIQKDGISTTTWAFVSPPIRGAPTVGAPPARPSRGWTCSTPRCGRGPAPKTQATGMSSRSPRRSTAPTRQTSASLRLRTASSSMSCARHRPSGQVLGRCLCGSPEGASWLAIAGTTGSTMLAPTRLRLSATRA